MNQNNPYNAYKNNEVLSASPNKLVLLLYDGAIRYIKWAQVALQDGRVEKVNHNLKKAQDILTEFMSTLDFEQGGEIAGSLFQLYEYMHHQLIQANIHKDVAGMEEVKGLLEELRETWARI